MTITAYHAKYFAHDLTRRASSGLDRLSMVLFDASVDLNPHQIEAAVFALESPLSKGVIQADEVGLGKTIEAGIVLCPASLRKQWALELEENLKTADDTWKVQLLEEDFHRLMFETDGA